MTAAKGFFLMEIVQIIIRRVSYRRQRMLTLRPTPDPIHYDVRVDVPYWHYSVPDDYFHNLV